MSKTARKNRQWEWPERSLLPRPQACLPDAQEIAAMIAATKSCEIYKHPGHVAVYCASATEYRAVRQHEFQAMLKRAPDSCRLVPSGVWFAHLLASRIRLVEPSIDVLPTAHAEPKEQLATFKTAFGTFSNKMPSLKEMPCDEIVNLIAAEGTKLNTDMKLLFSKAECTNKAKIWFRAEVDAPSRPVNPEKIRVARWDIARSAALVRGDESALNARRHRGNGINPKPSQALSVEALPAPSATVAAIVSSRNDRLGFLNSVGAAARAARESVDLTIETLSDQTGLNREEISAVECGTFNDSERAGTVYAILRGFFRKQDSNIPQVAAFNAAINQHEQAAVKRRI